MLAHLALVLDAFALEKLPIYLYLKAHNKLKQISSYSYK